MRSLLDSLPPSLGRSLLAALTLFVTLLAWVPFAERPAGFLLPVAACCLLVAVLGAILRAARLRAVSVVAVQLLAVGLWLHHRLTSDSLLSGWLPTTESLRAAAAALRRAGAAAQDYAAPVPATVEEFYPLLVVCGALSVVLVDLVAVGWRRPPLAGLVLLAVYTAPVSILDGGVPAATFAAAALCYLALIAADHGHRLQHWGHQLTPRRGVFDATLQGEGTATAWRSARRVGVTATALAVVAPLLVPTIDTQLFAGGPGGGRRGGGESVSLSNPIVDLKRDLVRGADIDLVAVTTDDPDPSYLRLSVLNRFDGGLWRPADRKIPRQQQATGVVPPPPGLGPRVTSRRYEARVQVSSSFASRWLPAPYPVALLDAPGDWRYDRSTLDFVSAARRQDAAGLTYRWQAIEVQPTAAELTTATAAPASVLDPDTDLPRGFPASIRRLARSVTEGRTTDFERAVALQQWFRVDGGFEYSLDRASGNGSDDLAGFLRAGAGGRVGYCEQFAAAMAAMGRSLGIPSRVAVGFLRPERRGDSDTWTYSSHDLHAWPEMYFGGVGWIRFEPTPQDRTGRSVPGYTTGRAAQPEATATASDQASAPLPDRADRGAEQQTTTTTGPGSGPGPVRWVRWTVLALAALALLGLLTPRLLRTATRRRRWAAAGDGAAWVEAAWQEVLDTAVDLGADRVERLTVRTAGRRLLEGFASRESRDGGGRADVRGPAADPTATAALLRLVALVERARYARRLPPEATTLAAVRADAEACVASLRAGAGPRRRRRAVWLPASVLRRRLPRAGAVVGRGGAEPLVDRAV